MISSGENVHPHQVGMVADLHGDPLNGLVAFIEGLIRELVEEVECAVAVERADEEAPIQPFGQDQPR